MDAAYKQTGDDMALDKVGDIEVRTSPLLLLLYAILFSPFSVLLYSNVFLFFVFVFLFYSAPFYSNFNSNRPTP